MPTTKREGIAFGLMMCLGMVIAMSVYNLTINGLLGTITFRQGVLQFIITFLLASTIELLIVAPIAKRIVFRLPFDKSKIPVVILATSACMVLGMVFFMSFYGLIAAYIQHGLPADSLVNSYGLIFVKNIAFAFPLQVLVMGPIVRFAFAKFVKGSPFLQAASGK